MPKRKSPPKGAKEWAKGKAPVKRKGLWIGTGVNGRLPTVHWGGWEYPNPLDDPNLWNRRPAGNPAPRSRRKTTGRRYFNIKLKGR